jgi:very-short-patch-repair endonuclease
MNDRLVFLDWMRRRSGLAHSSEAQSAGFTVHDVRTAVARADVRRVRRSWLVTVEAPPSAMAAVSAGGRLTCLSEAARLGLWTPDHDELHVSVRPTSSAARPAGTVFHWAPGPMPASRYAWHEPVLNVLAHVATCVPRERALAVWESAAKKRAVAVDHILRVAWTSPRARELASLTSVLSDSGLETILVDRLRPFGLSIRQQVWLAGHSVDVLVGDRLVVQIDGFEHHRTAKDRRRDIAHDARLTLLGYTVLRFDYVQILFGWREVESAILLAVAQGRHQA